MGITFGKRGRKQMKEREKLGWSLFLSVLGAVVVGSGAGYALAVLEQHGFNLTGPGLWRLPAFAGLLTAAAIVVTLVYEGGRLLMGKLSGLELLLFHIGPFCWHKTQDRIAFGFERSCLFTIHCEMTLGQEGTDLTDENASLASYYSGGMMTTSLFFTSLVLMGVLWFPTGVFGWDVLLSCTVAMAGYRLVSAIIPVRRSDGQMVLYLLRRKEKKSTWKQPAALPAAKQEAPSKV